MSERLVIGESSCPALLSRLYKGGSRSSTFVKDGLSYIRLPNPTTFEALVFRVKLQSRNVTIVNIYHAPDAATPEEQYSLLFHTFNRDVIILGDLNA